MARKKGYVESEYTRRKRSETMLKKHSEKEQKIEAGEVDEDGMRKMCTHVDEDGQRCMNFLNNINEEYCSYHKNTSEEDEEQEPIRREPLLEEQLRSEILLQISRWSKKPVHQTLIFQWILEGLQRLMQSTREV